MRTFICAAGLAAVCASVSAQDVDYTEFVKAAKANLARDLKDPASAQFRDLFVSETSTGRALCGEVNARNSYGGYVGFRRFYIGESDVIQEIESEPRSASFQGRFATYCATKSKVIE